MICDLDGTLLAPSGGVLISDRVRDALIALQEQGMTIVLASARIFQGVLPLARRLRWTAIMAISSRRTGRWAMM
ncbi:MAG: HAD hydrolase family protein [Merdibacter sp.]